MWQLLGQTGTGWGGGGGIPWQRVIQILFLVLIFGFSFLSWLIKALAERSKKKQQEEAIRRRREDLLRTGRAEGVSGPGPAPAVPPVVMSPTTIPSADEEARRRLAELAQRRRAEIERMGRESAGRAQDKGSARSGPSLPAGPVLRRGSMPAPTTSQPIGPPVVAVPTRGREQEKKRKAESEARKRAQNEAKRRAQEQARQSRESSAEEYTGESTTHRVVEDAPQLAPAPPTNSPASTILAALRIGPSGNPAEIQRALVLSELLGPPSSARDDRIAG